MINIEIIKQAITYTQNGKISEAKAIYDGLLAENPDDVNLLSVYGLFYVNIGNYDKACEILRKACGIKESFGTVSALGFAEYERGNFKEAADILEKAVSYGENPDIYNKLVMSLFEIRNYKKAVEFADKMYEKYPDELLLIKLKL